MVWSGLTTTPQSTHVCSCDNWPSTWKWGRRVRPCSHSSQLRQLAVELERGLPCQALHSGGSEIPEWAGNSTAGAGVLTGTHVPRPKSAISQMPGRFLGLTSTVHGPTLPTAPAAILVSLDITQVYPVGALSLKAPPLA